MVSLLSAILQQVLVASNTGGLKGGGGDLLLLVGHKVSNEREHIYSGFLGTAVEDSDLGIGDTSAESRLDVRLILLKAAATRRSWEIESKMLTSFPNSNSTNDNPDSHTQHKYSRAVEALTSSHFGR